MAARALAFCRREQGGIGMRRREEDEIMCATSEANQGLIEGREIRSVDIGLRLQEAFDYDSVSDIATMLRASTENVSSLVEGRSLPTTELLLGVRKLTGVSADWLLTGEGPKFVAGSAVNRYTNKPLPLWAITQIDTIRRAA